MIQYFLPFLAFALARLVARKEEPTHSAVTDRYRQLNTTESWPLHAHGSPRRRATAPLPCSPPPQWLLHLRIAGEPLRRDGSSPRRPTWSCVGMRSSTYPIRARRLPIVPAATNPLRSWTPLGRALSLISSKVRAPSAHLLAALWALSVLVSTTQTARRSSRGCTTRAERITNSAPALSSDAALPPPCSQRIWTTSRRVTSRPRALAQRVSHGRTRVSHALRSLTVDRSRIRTTRYACTLSCPHTRACTNALIPSAHNLRGDACGSLVALWGQHELLLFSTYHLTLLSEGKCLRFIGAAS